VSALGRSSLRSMSRMTLPRIVRSLRVHPRARFHYLACSYRLCWASRRLPTRTYDCLSATPSLRAAATSLWRIRS
jgi:hypothetical protein